jgi:hypothetical protein
MRSCDSGADRADELKRALGRHDLFIGQNVLQRAAFDKLHHEEWHGSPDYTEICDSDNVLVTYGGSRQRFLAESRDQHRIVSDEIRQNDFDCVGSLKKDMAGLKHDAHSTLAQPSL